MSGTGCDDECPRCGGRTTEHTEQRRKSFGSGRGNMHDITVEKCEDCSYYKETDEGWHDPDEGQSPYGLYD